MTDREILSNAIDKAIANGYIQDFKLDHNWNEISTYMIDIPIASYMIIFSHSFAKVYFQEDKYIHWNEGYNEEDIVDAIDEDEKHLIALTPQGNYRWYQPLWAYHLQQMVLEEEPIKYLEKYL